MSKMNPLFAYLLPAACFIILAIMWLRFGRDPLKRKDIAFRYAPPKGVTPAEAGVLIDERADAKDIAATLFDLASRRHFKIKDNGDDFEFNLTQDFEDDPGLADHEKALLKALFGRQKSALLSKVKESLRHDFEFIKRELYSSVAKKKYFTKNPEQAREDLLKISMIFLAAGIAIFAGRVWLVEFDSPFAAFLHHLSQASYMSGFLFAFFSRYMPKKTLDGQKFYERVLGLRKFLRNPLAAENRYEGYADEHVQFEKLLPYAIALDAADWLSVNVAVYEKNPPDYAKTKRNFRDFVERLIEELT